MRDQNKSKEELLKELSELRQRIKVLEKPEVGCEEQEKRQKSSEQRLQTLFNRHNAIMLLIEPDSGKIIDANLAASRFYGYSRAELSAMNISDINRLKRPEIAGERQRAKKEERNYFIFPHRLGSGEVRTVEVHSTPVDVDGQTLLFSIIHDVTDRKKAEEKLQHYQEHLEELVRERTIELETKNRLLTEEITERKRVEEALRRSEEYQKQVAYELANIIDSFPGLIFYKDTENRILRVNKYLAEAQGMPKDQLEGRSCFDIYPKEVAQAYWDDDMDVIKSGIAKLYIEEMWETPEGIRWVLTCKIPFVDRLGKIVGVIGISQDITDRKRAEEDREKLIVELKDALSQVKILRGLLPICASCKKIRNDNGYWEQMETYIRDHSEAEFSHSICPECAKKLYPNHYMKRE